MQPLCQFLDAWRAITGISRWLLSIIETLQFRQRPSRFNGVTQSLTLPQNAPVLRQEVHSLLTKGAIKQVHLSELESGYSRYFVVPKRDGGLCLIMYLRPIKQHFISAHSG